MGSIYIPLIFLIDTLIPPACRSVGCLLLSAETLAGNCPQLPHPRSQPSLEAFTCNACSMKGSAKTWQGSGRGTTLDFPVEMTEAALWFNSSPCLIWHLSPLTGVLPMAHPNKPLACKPQSLRICFLGTQPTMTSTPANLSFLLRSNPLGFYILKSERNLIRTIFLTIIVPRQKSWPQMPDTMQYLRLLSGI